MKRNRTRGQSLVEFAVVFPVFMFILAGMIQFGLILWGQNTLNQVVRDAARYAATLPCDAAGTKGRVVALSTASAGPWKLDVPAVTVSFYTTDAAGTVVTPTICPPDDNATISWVHVGASSDVLKFFPIVPANGRVSSSVDFRMEPAP
jgi:Flp pilus assembly protein TadG